MLSYSPSALDAGAEQVGEALRALGPEVSEATANAAPPDGTFELQRRRGAGAVAAGRRP